MTSLGLILFTAFMADFYPGYQGTVCILITSGKMMKSYPSFLL